MSQKTEKAIQWAMSLHPDERPPSVDEFRKALLGFSESPSNPLLPLRRPRPETVSDYLGNPTETTLAWSAGVLLLVSLLATLAR